MAAPAGRDVDRLVRNYMPLALRMADDKCARLPHAGFLHDDLRSAALLGLVGAAQRYNARAGSFVTWARRRIRGAMQDALRQEDVLCRRERAGWKGPGVIVIRGLMADEMLGTNAQGPSDGDADGASPRIVAWSEPDQDDAVARSQIRDALRAAIRLLPTRDGEIIRLYWFGAMTQAQLGRTYGVTETRINQILTAAHQQLRWLLHDGAEDLLS